MKLAKWSASLSFKVGTISVTKLLSTSRETGKQIFVLTTEIKELSEHYNTIDIDMV